MPPYNSSDIPTTDLVDSLQVDDPEEALLSLANDLHSSAAKLAEELALSLAGGSSTNTNSKTPSKSKRRDTKDQPAGFPIPLPKSLRDAPRPTKYTDDSDGKPKETPSRTLHKSNPSHALTHATLATESILSSLSKIASGGSAASSEMRALEYERQQLDIEALDIEHALSIREGCTRGGN